MISRELRNDWFQSFLLVNTVTLEHLKKILELPHNTFNEFNEGNDY